MAFIRRGLTYILPYRWLAAGALLSMIVVTAANLYTPQLFQLLIDDGILPENVSGVVTATVGLLAIALVRGLFNFSNAYWSEKASQSVAYDLRNELFTKLENLSFSYHDTHNVGQLMTRTTSDVEGVRNFFATGLLQMVSASITFIGSAVILLVTDWGLALAAVAIIPFMAIVFGMIFARMGPLFGIVQRNLGILNNVLQENLEGIRVVKGFTAEEREFGRYDQQNELLYNANLDVVNVFSLGFPTVFFLSNLTTLVVIWLGGNRVISGALSIGTLVAFNSYLTYLVSPVYQLGFVSQQLARAQASGKRIFEVLDETDEIVSRPDSLPLPPSTPGRITFQDVHFHYPGKVQGTLYDIAFDVPAGATVALLGPTGGGKSSITNLISRFYDVTEGRVLIDGHDVRDLELDSLRHQVGVVLQNVKLTSGTIRDNIKYGRPDAPDDLMIRAAEIAQASAFISQLSDGYDTHVGEGGSGLSGGQRQRIAIARTLLAHPRILIFDDSMSAVDADTEAKLREALKPYLLDHTAIIIAQRISTVRKADLILVIDQGRIVAQGTHDELLVSSPLYADIVHSQLETA